MGVEVRGVFDDDEVTVEHGRGAVYVRTGSAQDGVVCMLTPGLARKVSSLLVEAADAAGSSRLDGPVETEERQQV